MFHTNKFDNPKMVQKAKNNFLITKDYLLTAKDL